MMRLDSSGVLQLGRRGAFSEGRLFTFLSSFAITRSPLRDFLTLVRISCFEMNTPALRLLVGIFLIALASLLFEVSLTRIFSVTLWYHFGFLVIALAI